MTKRQKENTVSPTISYYGSKIPPKMYTWLEILEILPILLFFT